MPSPQDHSQLKGPQAGRPESWESRLATNNGKGCVAGATTACDLGSRLRIPLFSWNNQSDA